MGRKKKTFHKPSIQIETGNDRYDNQAGRIKAINTWDDIEHDSEDDYHERRGKILIDDSQKQEESESSEEEVFALQTSDTSSEEDDENQEDDLMSSDDIDDVDDFDSQTWGTRKMNYYDADDLSDFDEAKEEEEEALRLQKKRISKMSEEDFFDEDIGSASKKDTDKENEKKLMERLNQEVKKISLESKGEIQPEIMNKDHYSNLSRTEIIEILQDESPELLELLNEFKEKLSILKNTLTPILEKAKKRNIKDDPAMKFLSIKYHTLFNYLTNISFYLFLRSSETRHLRTHPVIDALVDIRTTWDKLEILESKMEDVINEFIDKLETDEQIDQNDMAVSESSPQKKSDKEKSIKKKTKESNKIKSQQLDEVMSEESDNENIDDQPNIAVTLIEPEFVSLKGKKKKRKREDTDLGDLDALDDVDANDKTQKRKSLRHHIAKIDQTLAKREKAIRLSGDTDIPYKDKDKSVKPVNNQNDGDDLDDLDWNDDDEKIANDIENGGEEDAFYLTVQKAKKAKEEQKKLEHEQLVKNNKVVYEEEILPDGSKRQINYQILKNKGLIPHRKKEQRNPRVKHRNRYEKAKKRIKSFKRVVVQQEGSYGGEKTGIKPKLSRSIKF
ncbi:16679_t:CDS:10, partial [Funneliformis caledonium]